MKRIDLILNDKMYKDLVAELELLENTRIFCHHDMIHFFDVARIMMIIANIEKKTLYDSELIYATALLHDVGRVLEYKEGIPHEIASAKIARNVLSRCMFCTEEIEMIVAAILSHRANSEEMSVGRLLFLADKKSRLCFLCSAKDLCEWGSDKQNLSVTV